MSELASFPGSPHGSGNEVMSEPVKALAIMVHTSPHIPPSKATNLPTTKHSWV